MIILNTVSYWSIVEETKTFHAIFIEQITKPMSVVDFAKSDMNSNIPSHFSIFVLMLL